MAFLDRFRKKAKQPSVAGTTILEANDKINKNNISKYLVKTIGFVGSGSSRGDLLEPEYNLEEIKTAADTDSYIKTALMKYSYLIFKAGYELKSENDEAREYLKKRFRIMSFSTGKPIDILLQEIADDLFKYSNAFLLKSRVDRIMSGITAKGVYSEKPVGGYFRVDPASMRIERDKNGAIKKYEQVADDGSIKAFKPTDVIHFYLDKDANNAFGTPRLIAALEDIKLLRRVEGNIISLIYRFAIPLYHWKIGIPEPGLMATNTEIEEAQREIELTPHDGIVITNERTSIEAIGIKDSAIDATGYLKYFENRVFSALNVSQAQMGRGGAKQDADSMEQQSHDIVKHVQRTMSIFIENYIIAELLLEGGFNPILNEDDRVFFVFNEISLDTKIKLENHEMLKFQSNLSTFEEARASMGKVTEVDENRLYINMIENNAAIAQIQAKSEAGLPTGGNGRVKNVSPNNDVKSRNMPTNQYGTTSVNIKESAAENGINVNESIELIEKNMRKINNHKKRYETVYKKYENLRNDITDDKSDIDILMPLAKNSLVAEIKRQIDLKSVDGMQKAISELSKENDFLPMPNVNIDLTYFYDEVEEKIERLLKDIKSRIKLADSKEAIQLVFSTLEYRIRFLLEYVMPKTYWYSFLKTGAFYGVKKAYVNFGDSEDAEKHPKEINTMSFDYKDIPAYHSFCDCKLSFKAGDKK